MANMFTAGDEEMMKVVLKKLMAVRIHRRGVTVGDIDEAKVQAALDGAGLDAETADEIYKLTSLPKFDQRFVIPPAHREQAIEMLDFTGDTKGSTGFGFKEKPERGM
jgi:nitrate reductase beta subunit